jgi:hypothetical protein
MAKAQEWVNKFSVDTDNEINFKAYAEETRKLINNRTGGSDDKTRNSVIDGALREQRQKWLAICNRLRSSSLTIDMFDKIIVETLLSDIAESQQRWRTASNKQVETPTEKLSGIPGRMLVGS